MPIKNILIPYSDEPGSAASLRYALKVAKQHDAWLTGVIAHGVMQLERKYKHLMGEQALEILRAKERDLSAAVRDSFEREIADAGWKDKSEFAEFEDPDHHVLSKVARGFDLVIVGPHGDLDLGAHLSPHPDLIALQSGRPILLVPEAVGDRGLSNHVLVAWDGKRSAARAVSEVMDILEQKSKITLVTIGDTARETVDGLGGVRVLLARHGIEADHINQPGSPKGVAQQILDVAADIGADLIVMGAYEHSKFSHTIKGGATTDVLARASLPVLLVH